ncbi:MAG: undecaprenyl-diphosphate phosphatase [Bdellovibrionaceae bacterium]|nr:undecaprenyl-diphosphate phosphatase [Pseudobdellovibrionaceae bacterium]
MGFFEAILLGIVQGFTEFLPVSSSGHLVILQEILHLKDHGVVMEVAVHVGTVLSILTVYFKMLKAYASDLSVGIVKRKFTSSLRLTALLIFASLPTALMGLLLKDTFERLFESPRAVGISLCITGGILFITKFKSGKNQVNTLGVIDLTIAERITFAQAFIMGMAQGCAITPGISRSGSTIATGILSGIEKNTAATFSFILSIPAVLGAAFLQLKDLQSFDLHYLYVLAFGVLSSYIAGILGLLLVIRVVKKGRLELFSYYLWVVGPLTLIFLGGS